ncbi:coenzyme F420-0:L-glutamate ligase [Humidisolicoccus flavus]|uniref:coenzyme F420-0:L-glutamate ligase n=1 Tax=Humidisolicoccus flavus TaxID=3111414 RepID=UPI0032499953
MSLSVTALPGIGEIQQGDDLARIIGDAIEASGGAAPGDIYAVTSKILSKAEGRVRPASEREAAIREESVRIVASRTHEHGTLSIVEHRLGLVMAAAGIDASNTPEGTILLLPIDPDTSARALCAALRSRFDVDLGIVVTDTFGRPWRAGQTDVAIGAAGVRVIDPLLGTVDAHGRALAVTAAAIADEIAAAADLVLGKTSQCPVAVVRGLEEYVSTLDEPGAARLVRLGDNDMFSEGAAEAYARGFADANDRRGAQ